MVSSAGRMAARCRTGEGAAALTCVGAAEITQRWTPAEAGVARDAGVVGVAGVAVVEGVAGVALTL